MPLFASPSSASLPPQRRSPPSSLILRDHKPHIPSPLSQSAFKLDSPLLLEPPSPTSTISSTTSCASYRSLSKSTRKFRDPYGTRLGRVKLWFEVSFGLSMLEGWERGLIVGMLLIMLVLLAFALYKLPGSLAFVAQRMGYYALGNRA